MPVAMALLQCWGVGAVVANAAAKQPDSDPKKEPAPAQELIVRTKAEIEREFLAAYKRKEWAAAQEWLLQWIAMDGANFVPYYNMACVQAQRGEIATAERMLESAVTRGFADRVRLMTDPDLAPLRETETYHAIIEGWERIVSAQVERRLEEARKRYREIGDGGRYTYERDEPARLVYISAFEAESFAQGKTQLKTLLKWWETEVLPAEADEPFRTGKQPPAEPWVMVILPTRLDYLKWVTEAYGLGMAERIGGEYSHDQRRLIAMDLGSTLRHEYWHVLHWRHMERLGQRHPAWVMEGLCSLVEDVEMESRGTSEVRGSAAGGEAAAKGSGDGAFRPLPSWRTNMTKRAAKVGTLMPLDTLLTLQHGTFVGNRPLAQYAHARALFMYLHTQGKLRAWYTAYVKAYAQDSSGRVALEETLGKPLKEIDRDFRTWLKSVPEVAVEIRPGMANLPFDVDAGTGDGIVVVSIPGSKGNGIRARDILTAINGTPLHDLYDYMRILSDLKPGDEVEVEYRRPPSPNARPGDGGAATERQTTRVKLIRQPG